MGTNTREELLGVWASLTLAHRLGIEQLQVLGDSKTVIDWLNFKSNLQVSSLVGWMDKIQDLITFFNTIRFDHIYREENEEADIHYQKNHFRYQKGGSITTNGRMAMRAPHYFVPLPVIKIIHASRKVLCHFDRSGFHYNLLSKVTMEPPLVFVWPLMGLTICNKLLSVYML
jgi:hypothetical protein